jgi:hypothetical protein
MADADDSGDTKTAVEAIRIAAFINFMEPPRFSLFRARVTIYPSENNLYHTAW